MTSESTTLERAAQTRARWRRDVVVQFFRPSSGRLMARCGSVFVIDGLAAMARADGDGFAAMTPDLEGVLLVNVEESLGDSVLDIDAWGAFVRDGPEVAGRGSSER